jgi:hypothetical protein
MTETIDERIAGEEAEITFTRRSLTKAIADAIEAAHGDPDDATAQASEIARNIFGAAVIAGVLYRDWWEREGRGDLGVCPCGRPAEDIVAGGIRHPAGHGLCPRHRIDLGGGGDRETLAQAIVDGTFRERDLTETEERRAMRVARGLPPLDA